jgi:hypothetical protein
LTLPRNKTPTKPCSTRKRSKLVKQTIKKTLDQNRNDIVISTKINRDLANGETIVNNHGLGVEGPRLDLE